ncbi:SGNH/GDSL hydrolase family protein [Levilactobacillus suantsaii]|uniref:SGNH/GDSL hydrolase family protein n=1 Tax=Levilactobacillus suantsaii TaxID=2292255 RepID=A0A4V1LFE0_9LACO|nr:SGNH/GDSL hydrolase family protein [Levilactobacillus suantsaii]QMU08304.1 SGNH/GDSL hydrolase family protein [Levilactobacillus suantsaii]RXI78756.1 SGNH/GDSL hydrolase family protein [Levilactobacillus suantsaii]
MSIRQHLLRGAIRLADASDRLQRKSMVSRLIGGNLPRYAPSRQPLHPRSPLAGKRIAFLGSSITAGAGSLQDSFVDYLVAQDGVIAIKEAVSGTTLAGDEADSYLPRMRHNIPVTALLDAFVCQLSTNDGRHHKALGHVTPPQQRHGFDTTTTLGAIETVAAYVHQYWAVPLIFYTCVRHPDPDYAQLVHKLWALQQKWHFTILDLWQNPIVKAENQAQPLAMVDDAHPTRLGYRNIWTPLFRQQLIETLQLDPPAVAKKQHA